MAEPSTVSVKVMRSYDYCHFEICLSTTVERFEEVDALRKHAARLADKAVEQYKIAKRNTELLEQDQSGLEFLKAQAATISNKPESERSERDKAIIKALRDRSHRIPRRHYDYENEWIEPDYGTDDVEIF